MCPLVFYVISLRLYNTADIQRLWWGLGLFHFIIYSIIIVIIYLFNIFIFYQFTYLLFLICIYLLHCVLCFNSGSALALISKTIYISSLLYSQFNGVHHSQTSLRYTWHLSSKQHQNPLSQLIFYCSTKPWHLPSKMPDSSPYKSIIPKYLSVYFSP